GGAAAAGGRRGGAGPAPAAAPSVAADAAVGIHLPSIDEWEVPIDCHACHGTYAVSFRHLRTGNVLRCPFCTATYIVTTTMHGNVSRALEAFHRRWRDDFEALSERRRRELNACEKPNRPALEPYTDQLKTTTRRAKPPGPPRRRAWIFG